ncbi:DUF4325 domain-containing protein [Undibacterium amnicola]|uniref:DUF4325 domain-containing protein n=1 Tax=Undibacterium amnicola TaxID=1834038 RepID=A0ABR6XQQ1_9BURK|nr:DUF4325 domain-containing protein [Undibacterium amnicola]MBC3831823.1 DUF4325 domain-containing protein [Undibacterium amnicola]
MTIAQQFALQRTENKIAFLGSLGIKDFRKVLASIHKIVNDLKYQELILDFTSCTAAFSGAMLPICSYVMSLRESRIEVSIILPEAEKLSRLFVNTNWAHYIEPRRFELSKRLSTTQVPVLSFKSSEEQNECVNRLIDCMLKSVAGLSRTDFAAVEWALNEITDNVLNHADSKIGGLVQMSVFERTKRGVEFTVCDAGIGIPKSLRSAKPELLTDMEALEAAIKEGVTRNTSTNQGNGLYGSYEISRICDGTFDIHSGNALLSLYKKELSLKSEKIPFDGTLVDARIDFSNPGLLQEALKFGGKKHRPLDFIESRYEQDNLQKIDFVMSQESRSFGSRLAARPVKVKIANLIEMCEGQKIKIDFSGVPVISSSFADEVFGHLFVELGPMRFMNALDFVHSSETIISLIDRAIKQRAALRN